MRRALFRVLCAMALLLPAVAAGPATASADSPALGAQAAESAESAQSAHAAEAPERFAFGAQLTAIGQTNTRVRGPFNPRTSFGYRSTFGWSLTTSIFAAANPWTGAMVVGMPEFADGKGLPNVSGVAGYPNGDIVRVPVVGHAPYLARIFFHQDIPIGPPPRAPEAPERFEARFAPAGAHAFGAGAVDSRIEITVGKIAASDIFDSSEVGTDPRQRFMNWALMEQGSWDYPADTRGYTWAAAVALEQPRYALRVGMALMPTRANGPDFDLDLRHARGTMVEGEYRYWIGARPGAAKLLVFANQAHMGRYRDAIAAAAPGQPPDIVSVERVGALKYGAGLLVDQAIAENVTGFLRLGANDGQTETFAFTEIDRSLSAGVEFEGGRWGRERDRIGVGAAISGLSPEHAQYLALGGHGFQLGDGFLRYGPEYVGEVYYLLSPIEFVEITADVQAIVNPGMNRARSSAAVFGLRVHGHL